MPLPKPSPASPLQLEMAPLRPGTSESTSFTFSPRCSNSSLGRGGRSSPPGLLLLPLPLLFHRNTKGLVKSKTSQLLRAAVDTVPRGHRRAPSSLW